MGKVYSTLDLAEALLLKDHLVHNGVAARLENRGIARVPLEGVVSEVWVNQDADGDDVKKLVRDFVRRRSAAGSAAQRPWTCSRCREENPGEFEICWSCGVARRA